MASRVPGATRTAVTSAGAGSLPVVMRYKFVCALPCSCRYISYCSENKLATAVYESNSSSIANSARVVSWVCATARKCHEGWPKKLRCSTTVVSIFAAFTEYLEKSTRYSRFSPERNGTGIATGAAGAGGVLACFLEGLDCCAMPAEPNANAAASAASRGAAEIDPATIERGLVNESARYSEVRTGPFQHANVDAATPPERHAGFRLQKIGSRDQLS